MVPRLEQLPYFLASLPRGIFFLIGLLSLVLTGWALTLPRLVTEEGEVWNILEPLPEGAQLRAGEESWAITPLAQLEEPDILNTWQEWEQFKGKQAELLQASRTHTEFTLEIPERTPQTLRLAPPSLSLLPWNFWIQLLTAAFCFLAAELAFRMAPRSLPLWGYRITGLGIASAAWSSSLYATRSLAVSPELLEVTHYINSAFGGTYFMTGIALLLSHSPLVVFRHWPLFFLGPLHTWLCWTFRWEAIGPALCLYPLVALYSALLIALLIAQRVRSSGNPTAHAIWRLQALAFLIGVLFFMAGQGVPVLLQLPPLASQTFSLVGFGLLFLLMSLGVTRYQLFSVSQWWGRAWLWIFSGAIVLCLDIFLGILLPRTTGLPLVLALLLTSWLYFPLRQWLFQRLGEKPPASLAEDVSALARGQHQAEHLLVLEQILHRRFQPGRLSITDEQPSARLSREGEGLWVPWPTGKHSYFLEFKQGGSQLFTTEDVKEADALVTVARELLQGQIAYARGEQSERERVRRDLHDHLGARLARLASGTRDTEWAPEIRLLIQEVRHVTSVLLGDPIDSPELLQELEAEARLIARSSGLQLQVLVSAPPSAVFSHSASERADLLATLREGLNNAARHGAPAQPVDLRLQVSAEEGTCIQLQNSISEGPSATDTGLSLGLGLKSLERRAQLRGGQFKIISAGGQFSLHFQLPLQLEPQRAPLPPAALSS